MFYILKGYKLVKVGMAQADKANSNGRDWNSYRKTSIQPSGGWNTMTDFEPTCNAHTLALSIVKGYGGHYGWLDADFPSQYAGSEFEVFSCEHPGKNIRYNSTNIVSF